MVFMFDTEKMLEQQLKEVEQWHEELPQESSGFGFNTAPGQF